MASLRETLAVYQKDGSMTIGCNCFLTFLVLMNGAAGFLVHGPVEPVVSRESGDVLLPCFVENPLPLEELEVVWKRTDSEAIVHLFQERESRPESQAPSYVDRAQFFSREVPKGNFSLLLKNVTTKDEGTYKCIVYTDQVQNETLVKMNIERLVVIGSDKPVYAQADEDVILHCFVYTHVPLSELEVEWIKTNDDGLVLLFSEGEIQPESQNERYSDRAEFFTEEIPNRNFSMKLRNIRTEDKGEYMCKVHTDTGSANATVQIQALGFSSQHIFILVLALAVTPLVLVTCALSLYCLKKKDVTKRALWIHCFHVTSPNLMISLAVVLWGITEGSKAGAFTTVINLMRILILFKVAPYVSLFSGKLERIFRFASFPLEHGVVVTGLLGAYFSDFLRKRSPSLLHQVGLGFGMAFPLIISIAFTFFQARKKSRMRRAGPPLKNFVAPVMPAVPLHHSFAGTFVLLLLNNFIFILIGFVDTVYRLERSVAFPVFGFLCILSAASWFYCGNFPAIPYTIVYLSGAVGLPLVNSIALIVALMLKAERGEETVDLLLITTVFESLFLLSWFIMNMHACCTKQQKFKCCARSSPSERSPDVREMTRVYLPVNTGGTYL